MLEVLLLAQILLTEQDVQRKDKFRTIMKIIVAALCLSGTSLYAANYRIENGWR